jgi:hypothetical protein
VPASTATATSSPATGSPATLAGTASASTAAPSTTSTAVATTVAATAAASTAAATSAEPATTAAATATPTAKPVTPARRVGRISGGLRIRGTHFGALLATAAARERLSAAVQTDLGRLLDILASLVRIESLALGSLVVDFSVAHSTTTAGHVNRSMAATARTGDAAWLNDTQTVYSAVSNETLVVESASVTADGEIDATEVCGVACMAFIGIGVLAAFAVVVAIAMTVHYIMRGKAAKGGPKYAAGNEPHEASANPVSAF